MKTVYIDVYFLINFTVDIISLYFAAIFSKIPSSSRRVIISALIGSIIAIVTLLMPEIMILKMLVGGFGLLIMGFIAPRHIRFGRRIKFLLSFLIFEALVGGIVSMLWSYLDRYLSPDLIDSLGGAVNRRLLIFSLIILLSIGVFKMIVSFFSNIECEGSVEVEISFLGVKKKIEAFVDSGNLAIDPMDMRPILLIKKDAAAGFLPQSIIELSDPDKIDREARKRIRLVPLTRGGGTHVLTGIKADSVSVIRNGTQEEIAVTVVIDKEGGSFGGFDALMPSAALQNAYSR